MSLAKGKGGRANMPHHKSTKGSPVNKTTALKTGKAPSQSAQKKGG